MKSYRKDTDFGQMFDLRTAIQEPFCAAGWLSSSVGMEEKPMNLTDIHPG